jgi:putative ABC transport system permease protein
MKIKDILQSSNTNLFRSKLRSLLTILAIFIGTFTLTLTTGLGEGVRDFVGKQLSSVSADGILTIVSTAGFGGGNPLGISEYDPDKQDQTVSTTTFSQEDINRIKEIENIIDVLPVYNALPEYITREGQKKYELPPLDQYIEGFETPLAAGRDPNPNNNEEILLAYSYLEPLGFENPEDAIDQTIIIAFKDITGEVQEFEYKIVGVLVNSLTGAFTRVNIDEIRKLSDFQYKRDTGAFALVATFDPDISEEKVSEIKRELSSKGYTGITIDDQINQINAIIDTIQIVLNFFAIIVILAAGIGIINTLYMSVYERTREIGLMKALGTKSSEIFYIFAFEALLIGFWGGLAGIVIGVLVGFGVNTVASATVLSDLQGFSLMVFPFLPNVLILFSTMLLGLIAGTFPALKASRLDPIEALRYE